MTLYMIFEVNIKQNLSETKFSNFALCLLKSFCVVDEFRFKICYQVVLNLNAFLVICFNKIYPRF